jgi:hypothetical protein
MKLALKIGIPLAVIMGLIVGFASPALAERRVGSDSKAALVVKTVQGKVVGIASNNSSFMLQNSSGNITVSVNSTTAYYVVGIVKPQPAASGGVAPGKQKNSNALDKESIKSMAGELKKIDVAADLKGAINHIDKFLKKCSFSDISLGDRVIARVGSNNVATQVLIIKVALPAVQSVKGTIAAVSGNTITLNTAAGPVTLTWDATTRFVLKGLIAVAPGQYATAAYNKNTKLAQVVNVQPTAPSP